MDYVLIFLPAGLMVLAQRLAKKDKNTTGADDDIAKVLNDLAPIMPALIQGNIDDKAADKVFLATYAISKKYLEDRGKLPE